MKKALLILLSVLAFGTSKGQYYYNPGSQTNPGNLNNDAEYPEGSGLSAGWTKIDAGTATSPRWTTNQTIPFTFNFNGAPETQFKVSTSGVLTFDVASSVAAPSYTRAALPSASLPDKSVAIWGLAGLGSNDYIFTKVFGTAGNRQLWIHFNSYSYSASASDGSNFTYWAIVLEEGSNKIYIVDQRTGGYAATAKQVSAGVQINATTAVSVTGSPNLASLASTDATPADNQYYEFVPGNRPNFDLLVTAINLNSNLALPQAPFQIKGTIKNNGATTINSFTINYTIDGGVPITGLINGVNIPTNGTYNFTHPISWTPTTANTYTVEAFASLLNGTNADEVISNDKSSVTVKVWDNFVERKLLHEIFTSATCPPCNPGNANLKTVLGPNSGKYSLIKYQVNFPGVGDPYYTSEVGTRFSFYGASFAPWLTVDGKNNWDPAAPTSPNANSYKTSYFNSMQSNPAFVSITPTLTVTGKQVTVTGTVSPLNANSSANLKMFVAICEKVTWNNVKTNGETEFYYVMKKMLPNANGTTVSLASGNVNINQSFTFPGSYRLPADGQAANIINLATEHSVEDFNDLVAVVFIQDISTKEILQSATTAPNWALSANKPNSASLNNVVVYPNPASSQFTIDMTDLKVDANVQVRMTDITGKVMLMKQINSEDLNTTFDVDCNSFTKGLYFIEFSTGSQTTVQKIMIR